MMHPHNPTVARPLDWREHHARLTDAARAAVPYPLLFATLNRGFFTGQQKLYNKTDDKRVKGLLYQYRVAMTGIVALETGEIEANVLQLNERFHLPGVEDLVARKVSGERVCVEDDAPYLHEIASLEPRLDEACECSALPDRTPPEVWTAAEDFLFHCRLAEGG